MKTIGFLSLVEYTNVMGNQIKHSAGGLALQVTKEARNAELVTESSNGDVTHRAEVLVYGFDGLLLVVDAHKVSPSDRAELVASLARETDSIHRGEPATIEIAGNGYQVQLPGCTAAGFYEGDSTTVLVRRGMLLIHDGTQARLARDIATIREELS